MASTRDRLIDAATRLLDEGGPAAVTLREVGRLAGVSHNAPYKHFGDKEELLAAVAARQLGRQGRPRATSLAGPHGLESLREMMNGYVRWALRYPARFKLTYGSWSTASTELGEAAGAARRALVDAVRVAQGAGDLPVGDPDRLRPDGRLPQATPTRSERQAKTMTDNSGSGDAVVIERSFDAPVDLIWQVPSIGTGLIATGGVTGGERVPCHRVSSSP